MKEEMGVEMYEGGGPLSINSDEVIEKIKAVMDMLRELGGLFALMHVSYPTDIDQDAEPMMFSATNMDPAQYLTATKSQLMTVMQTHASLSKPEKATKQ